MELFFFFFSDWRLNKDFLIFLNAFEDDGALLTVSFLCCLLLSSVRSLFPYTSSGACRSGPPEFSDRIFDPISRLWKHGSPWPLLLPFFPHRTSECFMRSAPRRAARVPNLQISVKICAGPANLIFPPVPLLSFPSLPSEPLVSLSRRHSRTVLSFLVSASLCLARMESP